MPIPLIAIAGASLIGSGIQAFSGARTAKNNLRAQQQRQSQIDAGAAEGAAGINDRYGNLSNMLGLLNAQPYNSEKASTDFGFNPVAPSQVSGGGYDPSTLDLSNKIAATSIDTGAITGNQGYNVGQDALMQFLRADPAGKMQGTNGILQEIAATGLPSDLSSIFAAATNVNTANNADLLASVTGTSKSVGQRFGSASQRIAGDTARRLANEQSLQNSQLALQAGEAASNRRLNAASTLGQFQLQGANSLVNAGQAQSGQLLQALLANQQADLSAQSLNAGQAQFNATAQNQAGQFNAQNALQAALANQQANNASQQFNVNAGFQAGQLRNNAIGMNNAQTLAERQQQQAGIQLGGQLAGQQSSLLNQLLGIRSGTATAQQTANSSLGSGVGQGFQDLASILTLFNRYGGGQLTPSTVGDVPGKLNPIFTGR